jgi:hypothetical protein
MSEGYDREEELRRREAEERRPLGPDIDAQEGRRWTIRRGTRGSMGTERPVLSVPPAPVVRQIRQFGVGVGKKARPETRRRVCTGARPART